MSAVLQLTVAALIESGGLDAHLRRARRVYDERRGTLADRLAPEYALSGAPVGVHSFAPAADAAAAAGLVSGLADAGIPAGAVDDARHPGAVISVAAVRCRATGGTRLALADALGPGGRTGPDGPCGERCAAENVDPG